MYPASIVTGMSFEQSVKSQEILVAGKIAHIQTLAVMTSSTPKVRKRRTQAERSDSMRKRLLSATLESLAEEGYANSTLSSIVRRAGVSRGAQVHHYPSKDALILDAAGYLMRRAYRVLGEVILGIANEDDRLQALLDAAWKEIFDTRMFSAFFELLVTSQRDPGLAKALRTLNLSTIKTMEVPIAHYFEKRTSSSEDPLDMFKMLVLTFCGIAASAHMAPDRESVQQSLEVWWRLMAGQIRARKGVKTPPQRPASWQQ